MNFDIQAAICRCCLHDRPDTLQPIHAAPAVAALFARCTGLPAPRAGDRLPAHLCGQCAFKCVAWDSFRQLAQRTDRTLREQLQLQQHPAADAAPVCSISGAGDSSNPETTEAVHYLLNAGETAAPGGNEGEYIVDLIVDYNDATNGFIQPATTTTALAPIAAIHQIHFSNAVVEETTTSSLVDEGHDDDGDDDDEIDSGSELTIDPADPATHSQPDASDSPDDDPDELLAAAPPTAGTPLLDHTCPTCHQCYPSARSLYRHRLIHVAGQPFKCVHCERRYKLRSSLQLHLRTNHPAADAPAAAHACATCGKTFRRLHGLQSHQRVHAQSPPDGPAFACGRCAKRFRCAGTLRAHERRHAEPAERGHACAACERRFVTAAELRVHARTHTGARPFRCDDELCERRFRTQAHLAAHRLTHTGERPHGCGMCEQRFASRRVCAQHRLTHTGEKPHGCEVCGRWFRQRGTLVTHMRTHAAVAKKAEVAE